jgi:hypothetical protein
MFRKQFVIGEMAFFSILLNGFRDNYETKGIEHPRILYLFAQQSEIFFRA